jgi:serine/threonine protein kinase
VIEFIGLYGDDLSPTIVTELAPADRRSRLTLSDLTWAVQSILRALNATHALNLFHRDIKWQNVLVSFGARNLRVIDWGLAEPIRPSRKLPARVGTTAYRAPELLMGVRHYGPEVDIWAAGVAMADAMFGFPMIFPSDEESEVLAWHTHLFGHERMREVAQELECEVDLRFYPAQGFLGFALPHTRWFFTREALDLLGRLLTPERKARVSAGEALSHPFFREEF